LFSEPTWHAGSIETIHSTCRGNPGALETAVPILEPPFTASVCQQVKHGDIWIGTSGWVYKQWAGNFYPKGWPKKNEFGYYVQHFPTVEINATFYRLPSLKMVRGWHDKAPKGFVFAVKGSRYLTHIKRLKDTSAGLQKYFRRLLPLGDRTGPILWQLPPSFIKNEETQRRLERFITKLPRRYRHAVEFRHPSWMDEETFSLLRRQNVANVWLSSLRMPADYTLTSDFAYLRFHGLQGGAYHDYTEDELEPWAKELERAARKGVSSYVYFNNDLNTRAPLNAHALMKLVEDYAVAAKANARHELPDIAAPIREAETWPSWKRKGKPAARRKTRRASGRRHSARSTNAGNTEAPAVRRTRSAGSPTYARPKAPVPPVAGSQACPPSVSVRRRAR
jgi:uncharacterized protein YecE (DUF72 family)